MSDYLYLRQNVTVEPLVDQWYGWAHLIPPATAARNLTERHLPIMASYIAEPAIHAAAVRNPQMLGGPFIDHGGGRVDEIGELHDRTRRNRAPLMLLSVALEELADLLRREATGSSLEPLYARVPHVLKGYVELRYDLNHRPSFRLIEPLLYRSDLYQADGHSVMLSMITSDDRPFVMSTPRLPDDDHLAIDVRFDDERLDRLFRMKATPEQWSAAAAWFDLTESQQQLFRSFFTPSPPAPYERYTGPGIRWRYFGHACILIETRETTILLDPVLSYTYESNVSRYTYQDLPPIIDYVVVTHNHIDHLLFETLLQLRHKIGHIVVPRASNGLLHDPSMALLLRQCGFGNVIELQELESIEDRAVTIVGWPFFGEHGDLNVDSKLGYLVKAAGHTLLFAADSCNLEPRLYRHLRTAFGEVSTLFLGMECAGAPMSWFYGPLMLAPVNRQIDASRRLSGSNYEQAMQMVDALGCRHVYVYAMGQEPWLNYVMSIKYTEESKPIVESNRLIAACRRRGIVSERLYGEREIVLADSRA